jgi:hypothetical protein
MSFNTIFVMTTILSSFDWAVLSSVMIYWNIVATALNMSIRDELFALGAWTDCLGTSCWLRSREAGHSLISPTVAGQACATVGGLGCCCCCELLLEENTLPNVVLGALCNFLVISPQHGPQRKYRLQQRALVAYVTVATITWWLLTFAWQRMLV